MKVRSKHIYTATQYNKRGDHPKVHVHSTSVPILDEKPGEENKWPVTGRLATLAECDPLYIRHQVKIMLNYYDVQLKDWIIEIGDDIVDIVSPEKFAAKYEEDHGQDA